MHCDNTRNYGSSIFEGTPWYNDQPDGPVYTGAVLYKIKGALPENTEFTVKDGTIGIAEYAFCTEDMNDYGFYTSGDHNLVKVTLPESIEFIGQCAFIWCTNLEEINFPEGLSQISNSAFVGCEKLKNVVLPEWLEKVEATVFSSCISINDITIPENVNVIESGAFSGCESLKKITILNPECVIEDTPTTICNIYDYDENYNETAVFNGTIYGYDNSTAQKYAEKYGYNFVSLGKAYIIGDCNDDGTMNIADVVTLQQFLLGNGGLAEWRNADLCKDERIDVFDMVLMRRLLIEKMYYYDSWY